ncbi:unnamed protein product, partial [Sphacelaria rigidula]
MIGATKAANAMKANQKAEEKAAAELIKQDKIASQKKRDAVFLLRQFARAAVKVKKLKRKAGASAKKANAAKKSASASQKSNSSSQKTESALKRKRTAVDTASEKSKRASKAKGDANALATSATKAVKTAEAAEKKKAAALKKLETVGNFSSNVQRKRK